MRTTDRGVWVIGRGVGSAFPAVSHREEGLLHHAGRTAKRFRCILAFFSFILAPRRDGALHRDSHAPHSIPVAIENGMVLASVTYKGASLAACGGAPYVRRAWSIIQVVAESSGPQLRETASE